MASESFFNNTTFFHTTYGMFHFNPDSGKSPILLLFSSYKFFSLRFFWGMHTSMTFVCGAKPHNPKVSDTKQVVLYAMSFFTTITCWLPVFVRRTLNGSLCSIQQNILTSLKNVYQSFGVTVGQFTKCLQCMAENFWKKVNPPIGLRPGHFKLEGMEFLKRIGLQVYLI